MTAPFLFLFFSVISIFFAYSKGLALYNLARLLILAVFALTMADLFKKQILKIDYIFAVLSASAVFQAIIGIIQFIKQGNLGLYFLGEPGLDVFGGGIAKITVKGAKVLRAYGTFPHPNILAAFLLLGLFGFYYLWFNNPSLRGEPIVIGSTRQSRFLAIMGIAIVILGLILTFSRAAWLVGGAISFIFLAYTFWKNEFRRQAAQLFLISGLSAAIFTAALFPYISARAPITKSEPSVARRLQYNEMALDLIENKPFGVGLGNQVLFSVREGYYQKFAMNEPWMWEPIHNIYLLIAVESGVLGGIVFFIFLLALIISNLRLGHSECGRRISLAIFLSFLFLGLFDHYFWTLQPGRLMLWLIIGIIMGISARSSTDRTSPSEGED